MHTTTHTQLLYKSFFFLRFYCTTFNRVAIYVFYREHKSHKVLFFHLGCLCQVMLWSVALLGLMHNDTQWHYGGALKIHWRVVPGSVTLWLLMIHGPGCESLAGHFSDQIVWALRLFDIIPLSLCFYSFPELDLCWVDPASKAQQQLKSPLSLQKNSNYIPEAYFSLSKSTFWTSVHFWNGRL